MTPLEELLTTLNVERYTASVWWTRPAALPEFEADDSPIRCAARRARMAADFDSHNRGAA